MSKYFFLFVMCLFNSLLFAELNEEQLWAIALTGIMSERNRSNFNTLEVSVMNERNKDTWLETLRRDWDVKSREELLETIQRMENSGHAATLKYIQGIVQETIQKNGDFSVFTMYNQYQLNSRQYNYLKFTVLNWNIFSNRSILAWDWGRMISLCRWGYQVGFLAEMEAWEIIMYFAVKIQEAYNSWEEYGFDYYMGRVFWASGSGDDVSYILETNPIYNRLIQEPGHWHGLKWNIDLPARGRQPPFSNLQKTPFPGP